MGDLADVYDEARRDISDVVRSLGDEDLDRTVPATPAWTIKDVVAHLSGGVHDALRGDYPREFFTAFGRESGVQQLNDWTARHIARAKEASMEKLLDEWEAHASELLPMLRGDISLPEGAPPFAQYVFISDVAAHQQDIYGALGLERGRNDPPVKVASSSFVGMMDIRMQEAKAPALLLDATEKTWTVGGEDPAGSVKATRFEFFRALSGRRSPEQVRAYEWSTDPDPYIEYFYPYGPREDSLEE